MVRFDDGEFYVELEDATLYHAQRALIAARRTIAAAGAAIVPAIGAVGRRGAMFDQEMAWEAGEGPEPQWLTDEENDLADLAEAPRRRPGWRLAPRRAPRVSRNVLCPRLRARSDALCYAT